MSVNIIRKDLIPAGVASEYYIINFIEHDNHTFSLAFTNFCDERCSIVKRMDNGKIVVGGQLFSLMGNGLTGKYGDMDNDDYNTLTEWVDGAISVKYYCMSEFGTTNAARDKFITYVQAKLTLACVNGLSTLVGPGIEIKAVKVDYNNYKEEDRVKTAIWCGEEDEYTIIGSVDENEFCIKEFSPKIRHNVDHSICKSFRFIKTKYIIRKYECKISR